MTATPDRWADLQTRVISAVVMIAVGATVIWFGGPVFAAAVIAICAVMIWELSRMTSTGPQGVSPLALGGIAALSLLAALFLPGIWHWPPLAIAGIIGALGPRRNRLVYFCYALLVMLCGYGAIILRERAGIDVILWLVLIVVASDMLGYFAGRIFGGPKFWPRVSPKKTWSGTVAGWIGAAFVGLGFVLAGHGDWTLLLLSPLIGFAGQMGDIAESWIKRRAGVKDSSNLLPGHGGLMDRFDALAASFAIVLTLAKFNLLPQGFNLPPLGVF